MSAATHTPAVSLPSGRDGSPGRTPLSWKRLHASEAAEVQEAGQRLGIPLNRRFGHAAIEENGCLLIPVTLVLRRPGQYLEASVLIVLAPGEVLTVEKDARLPALDRLEWALSQGTPPTVADWMLDLLSALNDDTHETLDGIYTALDDLAAEAQQAAGGFELRGRQAGVADIADTAVALGEAEELIARAIEGQLDLLRALRWARRFLGQPEGDRRAAMLLSDLEGCKRQLRFQHEKIRNIQQSLMTTLDLKQNQVIKVFAVVTAIFTPPTLVAAFYGQNFAYMPELSLPWMEWAVITLTGVSALLPLFYIVKKGWLR